MLVTAIVLAATVTTQQIINESVDLRLTNAEASVSLERFVDYPSGANRDQFIPNPKFWAKGVDFSCASPWNSAGGAQRAGTLISKRHIVFAKHFPLWKGVRIVFVDNEGRVCPCTVEGTKTIGKSDIAVGVLNADVTPNIHPAKILPDDFARFIGDGNGLPLVKFNQKEQLLLSGLCYVPTNGLPTRTVFNYAYEDGQRLKFDGRIVSGDSGNPSFLLVGDRLILMYCIQGGGGTGPALHLYRREIQKAMDDLCPGYKLEAFDFSTLCTAGQTAAEKGK